MSDIVRGHTFVSGEVVEAQSLNDLVSNAVVQPTLISEKVLKDPAAMSDRILIEDSGALKGITIQQIVDLVTPHIVNAGVPIGTVADFAGQNAPTGWFLCQGQLLDRDAFSDLFGVVGTIYSAGDGTSTFGIPDCRGRVVAALDAGAGRVGDPAYNAGLNGSVMGSGGGVHVNGITINQMPAHGHVLLSHAHTASVFAAQVNLSGTARGGTGTFSVDNGTLAVSVNPSGDLATTAAGGNQPINNVQPTIMLQKIIKALNA